MPINSTRGAGSAKAFGFTTVGLQPVAVNYFVAAGGASGGSRIGAGGGAGGVLESFSGAAPTQTMDLAVEYNITVGGAGPSVSGDTRGNDGSPSSFSLGSISASGGGGGGKWDGQAGRSGGD